MRKETGNTYPLSSRGTGILDAVIENTSINVLVLALLVAAFSLFLFFLFVQNPICIEINRMQLDNIIKIFGICLATKTKKP